MRSLILMIDKSRDVCGTKSEVARTLGLNPKRLYEFETGRKHMPAHLVMRLATLANVNSVTALGRYEAEWAGKKAMAAAAGIAAAACSLVALSAVPGDAKADTALRGSQPMHYAQRLTAWLRRVRKSKAEVKSGRSALARGAVRKALTTPMQAIACS